MRKARRVNPTAPSSHRVPHPTVALELVRGMRLALEDLAPHMARRFREFASTNLKRQNQQRRGSHTAAPPSPYDPCLDTEETAYLNRADVRAVLRVSDRVPQWVQCAYPPQLWYQWRHYSSQYARLQLIAARSPTTGAPLNLMIYSGTLRRTALPAPAGCTPAKRSTLRSRTPCLVCA